MSFSIFQLHRSRTQHMSAAYRPYLRPAIGLGSLLCVGWLWGCELLSEKIYVEDPNIERNKQLMGVVLISPEAEEQIAYVKELIPATDQEGTFQAISDANISMQPVGRLTPHTFDYISQVAGYRLIMPIQADKQYKVEIKYKDYHLVGRTHIPQQVLKVHLKEIYLSHEDGNEDWKIDLEIHDRRGEESSYHIGLFAVFRYRNAPEGFRREAVSDWERTESLFTDEGHDGEILRPEDISNSLLDFHIQGLLGDNIEQLGLEIIVLTANHDYYRYHKVLYEEDTGNPFSEPALLPQGLKGGVGFCSGYRIHVHRIEDIRTVLRGHL